MASEAGQQPFGESLDVQAIIISDSPKTGFHGQSASETNFLVDQGEVSPLVDPGEVSPTHAEVHEDVPSKQIAGRLDKAKSTRVGHSRPLLPNWMLLNSYIPP